jgi:hypothetical protein
MSGVAVPMIVEGERVFVDGTIDGQPARLHIDTGGGSVIVAEQLGLPVGETFDEQGLTLGSTRTPQINVGGHDFDTSGSAAYVSVGRSNILPDVSPGHAEGFIPGRVLARHHVVFDYPARTMSIDTGVNEGTELPVAISDEMKFPRIEVTIEDEAHGFLLDVGSSITMIPDGFPPSGWQRWPGAHGAATYFGGRVVETLVIPALAWGPFDERDVMCVSQRGIDRYLTPMMSGPMIGALGGNVLQHFRVTIDYPNGKLFVARP